MIRLSRKVIHLLVGLLLVSSAMESTNCLAFFEDAGELITEEKQDRLLIYCDKQLITEFVYRDPQTLRPYFCNVHTPSGVKVTRNHPPIEGLDAMDHATMHPGIWLGFGDINGHDFWRNKAMVELEKFTLKPAIQDGILTFATLSSLIGQDGQRLGKQLNYFQVSKVQSGIRIIWIAEFQGGDISDPKRPNLLFGDQEEMGLGVRVATSITEKNGGRIRSASGLETAKKTWGQSAPWCDYSGKIGEREVGLTVFCESTKEKPTWWHNRDYGLMVANAFGRAAMKQGEVMSTAVEPSAAMTLRYGVLIHEGSDYSAEDEYKRFSKDINDLSIKISRLNR